MSTGTGRAVYVVADVEALLEYYDAQQAYDAGEGASGSVLVALVDRFTAAADVITPELLARVRRLA